MKSIWSVRDYEIYLMFENSTGNVLSIDGNLLEYGQKQSNQKDLVPFRRPRAYQRLGGSHKERYDIDCLEVTLCGRWHLKIEKECFHVRCFSGAILLLIAFSYVAAIQTTKQPRHQNTSKCITWQMMQYRHFQTQNLLNK